MSVKNITKNNSQFVLYIYIILYRDILYNFLYNLQGFVNWLFSKLSSLNYYLNISLEHKFHFCIKQIFKSCFLFKLHRVNRFSQVWNPFPKNSVRPRITSTILCISGITCIIYMLLKVHVYTENKSHHF